MRLGKCLHHVYTLSKYGNINETESKLGSAARFAQRHNVLLYPSKGNEREVYIEYS